MDKDLALEGKTQINLWLDIFVAAYKLNGQHNEMQWTTQRNAMDNSKEFSGQLNGQRNG